MLATFYEWNWNDYFLHRTATFQNFRSKIRSLVPAPAICPEALSVLKPVRMTTPGLIISHQREPPSSDFTPWGGEEGKETNCQATKETYREEQRAQSWSQIEPNYYANLLLCVIVISGWGFFFRNVRTFHDVFYIISIRSLYISSTAMWSKDLFIFFQFLHFHGALWSMISSTFISISAPFVSFLPSVPWQFSYPSPSPQGILKE